LAQTDGSQDPISKRTRAKWTGGVAQAVELLLCKGEALSSNPTPAKQNYFSMYLMYIYKDGKRKGGWEGKARECRKE
jgi:hypothetical protein